MSSSHRPFSPIRNKIKGLLVLGDSRSDEYQADDARGGAYAAVTFNWLELLVRFRGVNVGSWGTRASPRRTGYEYNWSLSGDVMQDMIDQNQHVGGATQIAAGLISHVVIDVGANDITAFNQTYDAIYNSTLDDAGVAAKVSTFISNMATAIDTLLAAGSVSILVVNLIDWGTTPTYQTNYPNSAGRARCTAATIAINSGLASMLSSRPRVVLLDLYTYQEVTLPTLVDGNGNIIIDGQAISVVGFGDEPHHAILGDNEHLGTVLSALWSNQRIALLNTFGYTCVAQFTEAEMLYHAGITP